MLEPSARTLLLEALQPPAGYRLDRAITTTFTLDLLALLTAPLAFSLMDVASPDDDESPADPLALLDAARRHAERITVFADAGHILVPRSGQPLFALLERSVVPVRAPRSGGLFHPKVWLVRYAADDGTRRMKLLCSSRNLTFDRSWDTLLVLDGTVGEKSVATSEPLARFVETLPSLALGSADERIGGAVDGMAHDARRTSFEPPDGVDEIAFHPMGIRGGSDDPFDRRIDRLLVMSPFVGADALAALTRRAKTSLLVSRAEELERLEPTALDGFSEVLVLDDHATPEAEDADGGDSQAGDGLHAKCYVADAGWNARVWTGSLNATTAAFGANLEFMVEMRGRKRLLGIDALLATGNSTAPGLRDLLRKYTMHERPHVNDAPAEETRALVDRARLAITAANLRLSVTPDAPDGAHALQLQGADGIPELPEQIRATCRPVTLADGHAAELPHEGAVSIRFPGLGIGQISAFIAVTLGIDGCDVLERFTLVLPLDGAPGDRAAAILASVLDDPKKLARFLLLLLAADESDASARLGHLRHVLATGNAGGGAGEDHLPLLEPLLRSLATDPARLDRVAGVIDDLRRTDEGRALLPRDLDEVWTAIWTARRRTGTR